MSPSGWVGSGSGAVSADPQLMINLSGSESSTSPIGLMLHATLTLKIGNRTREGLNALFQIKK